MKRLSLLLVMIFILGMVFTALNASEVTIGAGDQQANMPVDVYWKNSLYECLYYQTDLNIVNGSISAVSFYSNFVEDLPGKPVKIWLGTTTSTDLSGGWIPSTELTSVFDGTVDFVTGPSTVNITFSTPFQYNGGTLVMLVNRPMDTDYFESADKFDCQTIGTNRALKLTSDSTEFDPAAPTGGTLSGQFPKTTFTYTGQGITNDLGILSLSGNLTPSAGVASNYTIQVKNFGQATQNTYTVKLMKEGDVEIGSVAGTTITETQTLTYTLPWTPAAAGATYLYAKVILTGDEVPGNNQSANLPVVVQPAGVMAVTIGSGDQTARVPMDMYYHNSLFETVFTQEELGITAGSLSSVAFYNNFTTDLPNKQVKIWLGTTDNTDLSGGWIPSTELTQVFDGTANFPTGQNTITIPFTTPFNYLGGNLVMMVNRPMDSAYFASTDVFLSQTVGSNRALNLYSDGTLFDPAMPPVAVASGIFPKTTFFYSGDLVTTDMAAMTVTGNTTPSAGSQWNYTVSVKNNGTAPQSTYQVKLFKEGDVEISSVAGTTIASAQTLQFNLPWTPAAPGATYLYAKVILAGDQVAVNNQTPNFPVVVQEQGIVAVTIGTGGSTGKYPLDMFYKASLSETIYLASELNIGGLLTGVQYYNNFVTDLPNKPVKIWAGETQLTDLSGGWIPSTDLTLVFDGTVNFPLGQNNITIPFTTPLPYGGGNLAIMVERPLDAEYFSSNDNFVTQTVGTNRTRKVQSDTVVYDPAAPPTATPTGMFPKTTFFFITEGMGTLNGSVTVSGAPLAGASVTVANSMLNFTTGADGNYAFPYIFEGTQVVSATKHGYNVVTHNVTVVEDQTVTQNFALTLLPQVTVTGRIVGSDAPTVGIAGATINLTGYEPYTATTDASGIFTINNVFASQTYNYAAATAGYQTTNGQVVVGEVNVNMGDIIVNEIAFPPSGVVATEGTDNVSLAWNAPGTGPTGFNDDFESYGDFVIDFAPWTLVDVDLSTTYGFQGITFPNSGVAMAYIIFNPATCVPALEENPPHSGTKMAACFASETPPNNDWMITPQVTVTAGDEVSFWARTYTADYGLERFKVGVSTTGTAPANFTIISGANYISAPVDWTNYSYSLSAYAGQQIYVGIQCISDDAFIFFVDDVHIGSPASRPSYQEVAVSHTGVARSVVTPNPVRTATLNTPVVSNDRSFVGYKVWRLLAADQANEAAWTSLTPTDITPTTYVDNTWQPLPSGVYKFAVKAAYTNSVYSAPAFSNEIHKGMIGTLAGTVTDFGSGTPIEGAVIVAGEYTGTTNAQGAYSFAVYQGVYNITCTKAGYQNYALAGVTITGLQTTTQNIAMMEIALPATQVVATEATDFSNVVLTWSEPGQGGGEWIHYDSGENDDSIGNNAAADFDVAVRYPASALADYAGMSLYSLKVWPAQAGTFSLRVWTGGTATAPGTLVVDQPFTPTLDTYNTVALDTPVTITGTEELWFGYRNVVTTGYPAGCDAGPATEGFGNMVYWNGEWGTLTGLNPDLDYNWNIQGYVGYSEPTRGSELKPLVFNAERRNTGTLSTSGVSSIKHANNVSRSVTTDRVRVGYKVWRLLASDQANEAAWTSLTPTPVTPLTYTDTTWQPLPSGVYKFAVKAVYTNDVMAAPAFSNEVHKGMMGVLTGAVTEFGTGLPVAGATVTAGTYSGITNTSGVYSFSVYAGTYNVLSAKPGYQPASQAGVVIVGLQTTTQNFVMTELTLPPTAVQAALAGNNVNITWSAPGSGASGFVDDFESYTDFAIDFAPWTLVDVDLSTTYGFQGITFPNSGAAMAYIIFNPATCVPALEDNPPHSGTKMAACFASETPPNNDWMISPQVTVMPGDVVNFWARTYTADYGLERFKVGVSTTGTAPANFTIVSGANYVSAPVEWTNYNYDLSAYVGQQVYVGIQCISDDAFIFFVDDFTIGAPAARNNYIAQPNEQEKLTKMDIYTQNIGQLNANERKQYNPSTGVVSIQPSIDLSQLVTVDATRALTGYKVWRLIAGQETNEPAWTSLTANPISATAYQDTGWGPLPDGTYKWAVKAVYTGGALSIPALSNPLNKLTNVGTIAGIVRNQQNTPIAGATVVSGTYTATTNTNGAYSMVVPAGTHSVTASHANYASSTQTGVIVLTGQTTTANFILAPTQNLLVDGFETYADFSLTFAPWTLVDVDQSVTYGIDGVTFQNSGALMAYIIFNPSATVPAITSSVPHGGAKMAASFAAVMPAQDGNGPNNDWLITPQVTNASQIKFWAKSHTAQYGLERFKVGVSTTGTAPADFTIISGATYISAPIEWTEYTYSITAGNVPVYIGIQCISNDAFIFYVDDVTVIGGPSANEDITVPVVATELKSNYPNPFNPETTIAFSVKEASPVSIEVYNVKGQLVRTLLNDVKETGNHTVVWNGKDNSGRSVSSGIYYYKMNTGKYSSTKKMIMMK